MTCSCSANSGSEVSTDRRQLCVRAQRPRGLARVRSGSFWRYALFSNQDCFERIPHILLQVRLTVKKD